MQRRAIDKAEFLAVWTALLVCCVAVWVAVVYLLMLVLEL